jgi:hypothetical protein
MSESGVTTSLILGPAPQQAGFVQVFCPHRQEPRSSILCGRTCANTCWADAKKKETRRECPAWKEIRERDRNKD